jgi:hypothetical protein
MKKNLVVLFLLLLASTAFAGAPTSTRVPLGTNAWTEMPVNMAFPAAKLQFNADIAKMNAGSLTNATTAIQYGTITNNGRIVFGKAFTAVPSVSVTWIDPHIKATTNSMIESSVTITNLDVTSATVAATNMTWIAIGPCAP